MRFMKWEIQTEGATYIRLSEVRVCTSGKSKGEETLVNHKTFMTVRGMLVYLAKHEVYASLKGLRDLADIQDDFLKRTQVLEDELIKLIKKESS